MSKQLFQPTGREETPGKRNKWPYSNAPKCSSAACGQNRAECIEKGFLVNALERGPPSGCTVERRKTVNHGRGSNQPPKKVATPGVVEERLPKFPTVRGGPIATSAINIKIPATLGGKDQGQTPRLFQQKKFPAPIRKVRPKPITRMGKPNRSNFIS